MGDKRIERIREAERQYHESCFDNYKLFEAGSWLHKPVAAVMELLPHFDGRERVRVLDLGCGIGRNAIPLAQELQRRGRIVAVDLLAAALEKLAENSVAQGVEPWIEPVLSDVDHYMIGADSFDLIVAVSVLEHCASARRLEQALRRMRQGTAEGGIACIIMNTNAREADAQTGEELEPLIEINLATAEAEKLLGEAFAGWQVLRQGARPLRFNIERKGRGIAMTSDSLVFVAKRERV